LKQSRQAFDDAQAILKDRANNFTALVQTIAQATALAPPTTTDLDAAEKAANQLLTSPDAIFTAANMTPGMTPAQIDAAKSQTKPYVENQLIAIYGLRKNDKRAVDDLTKLIQRDPTLAAASYQLGRAMLAVIKAENRPQDQPPAFFQIARAVAYDGPNALPASQKPAIQTFLSNAYKGFHGSTEGLDQLLAQAKNNPFPPANFSIKSTVDIAQDEEKARQAEIAKDPLMYLWAHTIKGGLATQGESFWENVKDTGLPPADDKATPPTPQYFKAHIISLMPATKPKEITVGIEKAEVADAKLTFETALPGKMDVGEVIEFTGTAKDWSHDPKDVVITFDVDPKEGLHGTWTGKNTPAPRAAPKGAPKAAPKAAPKQ